MHLDNHYNFYVNNGRKSHVGDGKIVKKYFLQLLYSCDSFFKLAIKCVPMKVWNFHPKWDSRNNCPAQKMKLIKLILNSKNVHVGGHTVPKNNPNLRLRFNPAKAGDDATAWI